MNEKISQAVIRRLPRYYRYLEEMEAQASIKYPLRG
jgi:NADH/NAD ratio-sensing transcriptional regulator Rex